MLRSLRWVVLALCAGACGDNPAGREVDLQTRRISPSEAGRWAAPALESGQQEIRVRQVFTALGPCRELDGQLVQTYPNEYVLRVVAQEAGEPCGEASPHIGYVAVLRNLPAGRHQLRVLHVGANGRTLAETVFEHPIVVTRGSVR